ncbi:MAG: PLP-dependent aspartate aminotransferase family protein [Anaerolineaceae bacterium]
MKRINPHFGIGTIATHISNSDNPENAHISPIFQTSTYIFPNVNTAQEMFRGDKPGYIYTRWSNPNQTLLSTKIACLEGLELLRAEAGKPAEQVVGGFVFSSGMAAITTSILAKIKAGDSIVAQRAIYSGTFDFLKNIAPRYGINVLWVDDLIPEKWEDAAAQAENNILFIAETPANPLLSICDLDAIAAIAHSHGGWLMVDNTFASPYCQRPLNHGADIVVHSTTKYLSGHGLVIGGAVISRHVDFLQERMTQIFRLLGGSASPFDCWLVDNGLKTFEVRMQRHCENAKQVAAYLVRHPKIEKVYYPGLETHPGYEIARRQMSEFGGMISFALKDGYQAGVALMNNLKLITLAVSLGTVDSLICHPASMTHANVPVDDRQKMGISEGLIRFSVGIENIEDILADLEQGLY